MSGCRYICASMPSFSRIGSCRICDNTELVPVLDLGEQSLTGVFPSSPEERVTRGPLEIVKCTGGPDVCGLLQLHDSYQSGEMYGQNYGYRSSLNQSMVQHLAQVVASAVEFASPNPGDVVIDIGSNDGTTLSFFDSSLVRVGVDPIADKFAEYYDEAILRIADFFSADRLDSLLGGQKAKIVMSIAMFYDLENPQNFVDQIASVLADDGVWFFEQSYMPRMLETTAYDTVCHEHLEYYAFSQVERLLQNAGLEPLNIELNDVNGGSFAIMAGRRGSRRKADPARLTSVRNAEEVAGLTSRLPFDEFRRNVHAHRDSLVETISSINRSGKTVAGYGASTKGNVILQFCRFSAKDIPWIAEVNSDKFGHVTPGTMIPIVSEAEARSMNPDYFLVLPWHFRSNLVMREEQYLRSGGKMIFPLPEIEILGWTSH